MAQMTHEREWQKWRKQESYFTDESIEWAYDAFETTGVDSLRSGEGPDLHEQYLATVQSGVGLAVTSTAWAIGTGM